jgi:alpha-glucosidase
MEEEGHLTLHLYPPAAGTSESILYSDAGDGYGEHRLDRFQMIRTEDGLELNWQQEGDYAFPYRTIQIQVHGIELYQVAIDGAEVGVEKVESDRPFGQVKIKGKIAE